MEDRRTCSISFREHSCSSDRRAWSGCTVPGLPCSVSAVGVPIISCMGAGNKVDTTAFEVADIYETSVCPLARVMRRELKKRGIKHLKVVYSKEPAMTLMDDLSISCRTHCVCPPGTARKCTQRRQAPGRDHLHLRGRRVQQPRCQRRRPGVPAHRQAHHLYGAGARLCGH